MIRNFICASASWVVVLIFTGDLSFSSEVASQVFGICIAIDLFRIFLGFLGTAENSVSRFFQGRKSLKQEAKREQEREEIFSFLSTFDKNGSRDSKIFDLCDSRNLIQVSFDEVRITEDGKKFLENVRKEKEELAKWEGYE